MTINAYPLAWPDGWRRIEPWKMERAGQSNRHGYRHELDDEQHRHLAAVLNGVDGMVVLSGYPCDLYDHDLYAGWERFDRKHVADGGKRSTEVVWLNQACADALQQTRLI